LKLEQVLSVVSYLAQPFCVVIWLIWQKVSHVCTLHPGQLCTWGNAPPWSWSHSLWKKGAYAKPANTI